MKNIYEILKSIGIEFPEEKKTELEKAVAENYKTVKEVDGLKSKLERVEEERDSYKEKYDTDIKQRDSDIKDLEKKLKDAGTDTDKLSTLQNDFTALQTTYEQEKAEYEKKIAKQAYEFAVKEKVSELKFSSNSAKKAFIADAMKEELKMKDGELQGFDGFLESYKKTDADAFISEDTKKQEVDDTPKPHFAGKSNPIQSTDGKQAEGEKPSVTFW